jgi:uncharacterized protein YggE
VKEQIPLTAEKAGNAMVHARRETLRKPVALFAAAAIVAGGALGGIVLIHGGARARVQAQPTHATIEVTGDGAVTGTPDTLTVQMATSTKALSATAALDLNNTEMNHLEPVLTRAGVKPADLQTNNIEVSPNYDSDGAITSYGAADDLTVTFHDIAHSGTIIDAATHAVGNDVQIQGISFSISNTSALLKAARIQAIRNAKAEASDLASGIGSPLGRVMKITDQEQTTQPPPREFFGASAAKSAVPVQSGSEQLSVQVDAVYELES